jgi:hypothetical protein
VGDLLTAKYFPHGTFFESMARWSAFWNGIQAVKPVFALSAYFHVQNGKSIQFWYDSCLDLEPLWMSCQELFTIAKDPDISVAEELRASPPAISFRRELSPVETACWTALCGRQGSVTLSTMADMVSWHLIASRHFSIK